MTTEEFYDRFEFNSTMSGSLLGRGGFSSVYKVYDKVRRRYVAIKRSEVGSYAKFDLDREVKLANEIEYHPNIIRYENVERISDRAGTFDYAILKYYAEGNLDNVLGSHSLNDTERRQILTGILKGLAHLHKIPIIHRDFKTANVLMDRDPEGNWIPIIADFGLSRLVDADMSYVLNNSQIAITPNYASPEQYKENDALRPNTDLWAFGVMTYKMMTGKLPFRVEGGGAERDTSHKIRTMVLEGQLPGDIAAIPEPFKSIILQCLVVDPGKRAKRAEDLLTFFENPGQPAPKGQTLPDAKTQPYKAGKPVNDPATKIIPPKVVETAPTPPVLVKPPRKFPKEVSMLMASLLLLAGMLYWFVFRPEPVAATDIAPKELPAVDSLAAGKGTARAAKPQKERFTGKSKRKETNTASVGFVNVFTKYHDLKVFIEGNPQVKIARAGETTTYRLPVGEGIFFKVVYVDFGMATGAEPLTVSAGQVISKSFTEKLN